MTKNIIQLYYKQKKEIQELYKENDDLNQRRWDILEVKLSVQKI